MFDIDKGIGLLRDSAWTCPQWVSEINSQENRKGPAMRMHMLCAAIGLCLLSCSFGMAGESDRTPDQPGRVRINQAVNPGYVSLSADGLLVGRFAVIDPVSGGTLAAESVDIYFVKTAQIVAHAKPGVDGIFQADVPPGVYSMIVTGADGFWASSVCVVPSEDSFVDQDDPIRPVGNSERVGSTLQIEAAIVPSRNFRVLQQLIQEYANVDTGGSLHVAQQEPVPDDEAVGLTPTALGKPVHTHVVRLEPDGRMAGRLRRMDPESGELFSVHPIMLSVIQEGQLVVQTPVDETGAFEVRGLKPGRYSFVAAGPEGIAAFEVQVLAFPGRWVDLENEASSPFRQVRQLVQTQNGDGAGEFEISLADPQDVALVMADGAPPIPEVVEAPAGGGGGGGAMGGGAGGGMGGLTGTLLGVGAAAGIGVGVAAATKDDDDTPASPATP